MKTVTKIDTAIAVNASIEKRVAAYARVSSGKDAMLHSLSAQVDFYSKFIRRNAEWIYCGVYADEAYTGMRLQKTFIADHISKKQVANEGQLPQYYVRDAHEAIIDRDTFVIAGVY